MFRRWWRARRRKIFNFHDGTRKRYSDPLEIQERLYAHEEWDEGAAQITDKEDEFGDKARAQILACIRHAFQVEPFEDAGGKITGLTLSETWDLYTRWCWYMVALKKNTRA